MQKIPAMFQHYYNQVSKDSGLGLNVENYVKIYTSTKINNKIIIFKVE
jgi:hypothetical protein